jgi:hypothetical protein
MNGDSDDESEDEGVDVKMKLDPREFDERVMKEEVLVNNQGSPTLAPEFEKENWSDY